MTSSNRLQFDPYSRHAAPHASQAYAPVRPEPFLQAAGPLPPEESSPGLRLDGLAIAALVIVAFLVLQSVLDRDGGSEPAGSTISHAQSAPQADVYAESQASSASRGEELSEADAPSAPPAADVFDPTVISYPYDSYWVTQGPHGFSYGHMAIDIAAGKGAPVKSPIDGEVTANYVDQYGNTTLVIENEIFRVTLLHGDFIVQVGQVIRLGDVVGAESNNGYTTDMQGRSCRNRNCGYHSHLNVFNKVINANVNPLDVLQ